MAKSCEVVFMQFSPPPCHLIPLQSKHSLSTLFSSILQSSLNVCNQVLHTQRTTGTIKSFVDFIFHISEGRPEDKRFWIEQQQALLQLKFPLISFWMKFWFLTALPKCVNCATFLKDLSAVFMSWFLPASWWQDSNKYLALCIYFYTNLLTRFNLSFCYIFASCRTQ
jgi:hypothetical protein